MPELEPVMTACLPLRSIVNAMLSSPLRRVPMLHLHYRRQKERGKAKGPEGGKKAKRPGAAKKKRQHEAGVKLLRQVSYRQETYRAVPSL
jgi:hypothetical protein